MGHPVLFSFQEVSAFHSFLQLRILQLLDLETPSSLVSRWEESSTLHHTVLVFSLTPRDVVEPLVMIWPSHFHVFSPEKLVMTQCLRRITKPLMLPKEELRWK